MSLSHKFFDLSCSAGLHSFCLTWFSAVSHLLLHHALSFHPYFLAFATHCCCWTHGPRSGRILFSLNSRFILVLDRTFSHPNILSRSANLHTPRDWFRFKQLRLGLTCYELTLGLAVSRRYARHLPPPQDCSLADCTGPGTHLWIMRIL